MTERLVVLLDMDCFYVQVEERHYPHIKGVPAAVVQYNAWKGGGIIAVNYEARDFGVKRGMRGDEARSKCPDIQLVTVPVNRGKADLTRYRDAGKEVIDVLCDYSDCVERASIDEAYLDFTSAVQQRIKESREKITGDQLKSTWVVGYDDLADEATPEEKEETRRKGIQEWLSSLYEDKEDESFPLNSSHPNWGSIMLAHTAILCEEMRAAVLERTGFNCSAGIAHNKILGKLSCGLHKPNQQTVIPQCKIERLWSNMPVGKVRNLGGKLGDTLTEELGCNTMGDLGMLSLPQLTARYDNKTAQWLFNLGKGIDNEQVTSRQLPKSIGCGKNFQGKEALNTREKVQKWMLSLAEELTERLNIDQTANKRRAKTLTISIRIDGDARFTSMSRSSNLPAYCAERIARVAISMIQHTNQAPSKTSSWHPAIKNISLCAGKFEDWMSAGSGDIQEMFKKVKQNPQHNLNGSNSESPKKCDQETEEVLTTAKDLQITRPKTGDLPNTVSEKSKTSPSKISPNKSKTSPSKSDNSKTSPLMSNSFFRNLLQKRETQKAELAESVSSGLANDTDAKVVGQGAVPRESGADSDDGDEENNDLDLLVSCLSDEEEASIGENGVTNGRNSRCDEESDGSMYDAETDVDSSFSSEVCGRLQLSQDLFAEDDAVGVTVKNSRDCVDRNEKKVVCNHPNLKTPSKQVVAGSSSGNSLSNRNESVTPVRNSPKKTSLAFEIKQTVVESEGNPNVSVKELFPDLDNFDESLLSVLPKELKLEVEKALREHKTNKAKSQQRKSGLWKYVTSIPSPQKNACRTPQKTCDLKVTDDAQAGPSRIELSKESRSSTGDESVDENRNWHLDETCRIRANVDSSKSNAKDSVECEECGLKISAFEVPEHADYHMALSLQTDMRKEVNQTNRRVVEKVSVKNGKSNRGRKRNKANVKTSVKDCKIQKLDSFFKS